MEAVGEKKTGRSFWRSFYNFLAYGGIILVIMFIAIIAILISALTS